MVKHVMRVEENTPVSLTNAFWGLVRRDIRLAWGQGGTGTMVLSFFLIAVALFPFGVGPEPQILARIASGVVFVVVLLATLISLDRIFQADFEDGSLDQMSLSPMGLWGVVSAKILAHWVSALLPLAILAPFVALMVNLPASAMLTLFWALLIATPALSLIGAIGAGLTVALRRGGVLLSLLVLPLYIPSLIFGVGAVDAVILGGDAAPHLALLGAVSLLSLLVGVPASVFALKLALE